MENLPRINRRTALKWMLTAAASTALAPALVKAGSAAPAAAQGYGTDPDLLKVYQPGELWPLTFTEAQRHTAAVLSDIIIPAEGGNPAASAVGVVDFIDEWISAPYPQQAKDRPAILSGLEWIDAEAMKRGGRPFAQLAAAQQAAICDDICQPAAARPEFKTAAHFFSVYRNLTAGGYYTTPQGAKDIGYVGNTPIVTFDGPPPEVLRQAGLV